MKVTVLFFAHLKEKATGQPVMLDVAPGSRVQDLKRHLLAQYPALEGSIRTVITSINRQFAGDDDLLPEDAEVAFFPPVSGGAEQAVLARLTEEEILVDPVIRQLSTDSTGGICLFTGVVRATTTRGKPTRTVRLEYEAYPEMAEEKMHQIAEEIKGRWSAIDSVVIIQRIGEIAPGEVSVLIACSGSHRDAGIFDAVHYGIDRLKEIVPVWKKEFTDDGDYWVEGNYFPTAKE